LRATFAVKCRHTQSTAIGRIPSVFFAMTRRVAPMRISQATWCRRVTSKQQINYVSLYDAHQQRVIISYSQHQVLEMLRSQPLDIDLTGH
jgi:hypothetical protein